VVPPAAVSLWLDYGVPATEVARRAGPGTPSPADWPPWLCMAIGGSGDGIFAEAWNGKTWMIRTVPPDPSHQARAPDSGGAQASGASADKGVSKAGKVVGFDMLRFAVNPKTGTASIGVVVDTSGGFLYGTLHESNGPLTHGKVTGGTGKFAGAGGTITARSNKAGTRTAVTITYHT
jgi:hypothetical protein